MRVNTGLLLRSEPRPNAQAFVQLYGAASSSIMATQRLSCEPDCEDLVKQVNERYLPVLLLESLRDHLMAPTSMQTIQQALPHALFHRYADCGHAPFLECPEVEGARIAVGNEVGHVHEVNLEKEIERHSQSTTQGCTLKVRTHSGKRQMFCVWLERHPSCLAAMHRRKVRESPKLVSR